LRELYLNNTPYITDQAVEAIASSKLSLSLSHLDLKYTNITNRSLEHLASSKFCLKLATLNLCGCENINMSGLKKFLDSVVSSNLLNLDASWLRLDNTVFGALLNHPRMGLKKLIMTGVKDCWDNMDRFIDSRAFECLELLDLSFSTGIIMCLT
jgi:hypothetical protein